MSRKERYEASRGYLSLQQKPKQSVLQTVKGAFGAGKGVWICTGNRVIVGDKS